MTLEESKLRLGDTKTEEDPIIRKSEEVKIAREKEMEFENEMRESMAQWNSAKSQTLRPGEENQLAISEEEGSQNREEDDFTEIQLESTPCKETEGEEKSILRQGMTNV